VFLTRENKADFKADALNTWTWLCNNWYYNTVQW